MRAAKIDRNQTEIVAVLRARGHRVQSLAKVGDGCPDLLVGTRRRSLVVLEVKDWRNQRGDPKPLTPKEKDWFAEWLGWPVYVVSTAEEAICAVEFGRARMGLER